MQLSSAMTYIRRSNGSQNLEEAVLHENIYNLKNKTKKKKLNKNKKKSTLPCIKLFYFSVIKRSARYNRTRLFQLKRTSRVNGWVGHNFDLFLCTVMLVDTYLNDAREVFTHIWVNSTLCLAVSFTRSFEKQISP